MSFETGSLCPAIVLMLTRVMVKSGRDGEERWGVGGVIVCMGIEVFEIRPRTFKGLGEG